MTEEECLDRFGISPHTDDLPEIRRILEAELTKEKKAQGNGDTELMKLCCVQLFLARFLDDIILIFCAKMSSMDADASIDIQLLCGAGLEEAKRYLKGVNSDESQQALLRLEKSESAGDFDDFSVDDYRAFYFEYYQDEGDEISDSLERP